VKLLVAKGQHDGSFDAAWYHRGLEIAWKSKSFEIIKYLISEINTSVENIDDENALIKLFLCAGEIHHMEIIKLVLNKITAKDENI